MHKYINENMNTDLPKVSIITVCFNSAQTIADTIESVIKQTYPNIEYIIVDGASTDGTVEIIRENEQHINKWISEPDNGLYYAMNKGINLATGELIGMINSDDWYPENAIDLIVKDYLKIKSRNYVVIHGDNIFVDPNKNFVFMLRPDLRIKDIHKEMVLNHPGSFITKASYERYGLYNTEFKLAADYELFLRLYKNNVPFQYIDAIIAYVRLGGIGDVNTMQSLKELRQISVEYGYKPWKAFLKYYYTISKTRLKKWMRNNRLNYFIQLKRSLSPRTRVN